VISLRPASLIVRKRPRQLSIRLHVQLPQHIFFPRSQSLGTNGLDVCVGNQAKHPQVLLGADKVSKSPHHHFVGDVTALENVGHLQVAVDQKPDLVSILFRKIDATDDSIDSGNALLTVVPGIGFPHVME
jgi:hypothetical protein